MNYKWIFALLFFLSLASISSGAGSYNATAVNVFRIEVNNSDPFDHYNTILDINLSVAVGALNATCDNWQYTWNDSSGERLGLANMSAAPYKIPTSWTACNSTHANLRITYNSTANTNDQIVGFIYILPVAVEVPPISLTYDHIDDNESGYYLPASGITLNTTMTTLKIALETSPMAWFNLTERDGTFTVYQFIPTPGSAHTPFTFFSNTTPPAITDSNAANPNRGGISNFSEFRFNNGQVNTTGSTGDSNDGFWRWRIDGCLHEIYHEQNTSLHLSVYDCTNNNPEATLFGWGGSDGGSPVESNIDEWAWSNTPIDSYFWVRSYNNSDLYLLLDEAASTLPHIWMTTASPINTSNYNTTTILYNVSAQGSNASYTCNYTLDGIESSSNFTIVNNTFYNETWTGLSLGPHTVNSTCSNLTLTNTTNLTFFIGDPLAIRLDSPINTAYYAQLVELDFVLVNSTMPSAQCWLNRDGNEVSLGNLTLWTHQNRTESFNTTSHSLNITCQNALGSNVSSEVMQFTVDLYNLNATTFLPLLFETNTTPYNLSLHVNTFVSSITATLQFNATNYTTISAFNVSSNQYYLARNQTAPLLLTNNSLVNHTWYATFVLANGTSITQNITNASQAVYFAYGIQNVTSNQSFAVEGEIIEFSMNFWNNLNNATLNASGHVWNPTVIDFELSNASYIEWNGSTQVLGNPETNISAYTVITFEGISRALMSTNQTITTGLINISLCGAAPLNVPFLRYFHRDEENQSIINGSNEVTFTIWNIDRTFGRNYSFPVNNVNNWTVCFQPNYGSFLVDSFHEYTATPEDNSTRNSYTGRTHFLRNALVTNETSNITLYSLNTTWSDLIRITVREDSDRSLSRNTVMQLKRYFPSNGTYRTVATIRTGTDGIGETWLRAEDTFATPYYSFSFIRDDCAPECSSGDLPVSTQIVDRQSDGSYELTLYLPYTPIDRQYFYQNLVATCAVNATEVSCRFTDTTGLSRHWNLTLDIWTIGNFSGLLRDCNNYSYGDTVLLTCALSTNRSYMYQGWITINNNPYNWYTSGYNNTIPFDWGRDALFAMLLLFSVVTLAGVRNPGTYGILAVVSIAGGLAIGIIYLSTGVVWELLLLGLIMIVGFYLYRSRT